MPSPTGNAIPLAYGYVWGTGEKVQGITLENTGNDNLDYSRVGAWVLGQDEWDGLEELWDKTLVRKLYTNEYQTQPLAITGVNAPTNAAFHFHRGCDATIGGGLAPTSIGPDQGVDTLFQYLPSGVQPLCYNRQSMFWLMLKQWVASPENDHQDNPNNFTDIDPIGLWRGLRLRLFDDSGTMNGYAFSTNPSWQMLDVLLRMRLYPEYNLSLTNGPDDLTAAVRRRLDWPAWSDLAARCDIINDQNRKSYEGCWLFNQPTTLQGLHTPMLQACRSYMVERGGVFGPRFDQNRASVFTISQRNLMSLTADDKDLHTAPNCETINFRDVLVPAINGIIVSITYPDHDVITVTMSDPHGLAADDEISIGGTNTTYDRTWNVDTVPDGDEVYIFTLVSQGSNFPPFVGSGGRVGLTYARFKERAPEFSHHRAQLSRGAAGIGLDRQRNKIRESLNLGSTTFDQAYRVGYYEIGRRLGPDATPYIPPAALTVELDPYAQDAAGTDNRPIGLDPGDVVTVDDTASVPYAGLYEVVDGLSATPDTVSSGTRQAGKVTLRLQTFGGYFVDSSDPAAAGWPNVPGSDPGNGGNQADIPLKDGTAGFYTGLAASGSTMPVPSSYAKNTLLSWAGAGGFIESNNQLHVLRNCDVDPTSLILSCIYSDGNKGDSNVWNGDNTYAGLVSRTTSSRNVITIGPMTYHELTLANNEKVIFGSGLVSGRGSLNFSPSSFSPPLPAPYTVGLPSGYSLASCVCVATIKDGIESGDNDAHGFSAWVDASGLVHSLYQDGDGNQWCAQYVRLFVFGWLNNMGTIKRDSLGWYKSKLTPDKTLCWMGFESYDAGLGGVAPPNHPGGLNLTPLSTGTLPMPDGVSQDTLQVFTGPTSFQIVDHPTHGIRDCFVNYELQSLSSFEDGEGHIWYGTASGFALLCDGGPDTGDPVTVGPAPF